MVIGILNFGEGLLGLHYLIFCTAASLGALQLVAAHARLVGLMFLPAPATRWLGALLAVGAFAWFFTVQPDLFIPGLAGGEFFTLFFLGFGGALVIALGLSVLANRVRVRSGWALAPACEHITLGDGQPAELGLPARNLSIPATPGAQPPPNSLPPVVIALREAEVDSLDILGRGLVAGGAAVLLCDQGAAEAALAFVEQNAGRFHPQHRYLMGVGRGADRALQLAGTGKIRAVLALGPLGREDNTRAGLRWLSETDYLTAWRMTRRNRDTRPALPIRSAVAPANALVVYGDEDLLIPPALARELYPSAVMIAGARHFTLAALPATRQLAGDLFDMRTAAPATIRRPHPVSPPAQGELGE